MQHYYIDTGNGKDGPHDLVTIMRRIHGGKVNRNTGIYLDRAEEAIPAGQIPDIAPFFAPAHGDSLASVQSGQAISLKKLFASGWQFTMNHNIMTVFAGLLLLLGLLLGVGLADAIGPVAGGMTAWCLFLVTHHLYLVFALRLYRGQPLSADFFNHRLAPALPGLLIFCLIAALLMAAGFALLIVPGVFVAVVFIFVPFILLDQRIGFVQAMKFSKALLGKHEKRYLKPVATLVSLHLLSLLLIIPTPLTLPIFAAALAELYEALTSS